MTCVNQSSKIAKCMSNRVNNLADRSASRETHSRSRNMWVQHKTSKSVSSVVCLDCTQSLKKHSNLNSSQTRKHQNSLPNLILSLRHGRRNRRRPAAFKWHRGGQLLCIPQHLCWCKYLLNVSNTPSSIRNSPLITSIKITQVSCIDISALCYEMSVWKNAFEMVFVLHSYQTGAPFIIHFRPPPKRLTPPTATRAASIIRTSTSSRNWSRRPSCSSIVRSARTKCCPIRTNGLSMIRWAWRVCRRRDGRSCTGRRRRRRSVRSTNGWPVNVRSGDCNSEQIRKATLRSMLMRRRSLIRTTMISSKWESSSWQIECIFKYLLVGLQRSSAVPEHRGVWNVDFPVDRCPNDHPRHSHDVGKSFVAQRSRQR